MSEIIAVEIVGIFSAMFIGIVIAVLWFTMLLQKKRIKEN
ncbi:MAG: hypothetical protein QG670_2497 [Thermoproteota archaeon]|nr:hypothetical protein [Thermoproteota archaeon]